MDKESCLHIVTPVIYSEEVSNSCNCDAFLKLDNLQPSGSFKIRGIGHMVKKVRQ